MGCDVCIDAEIDSDEILQNFHREERKARKPHKCCECKAVINPGEMYQHDSGVFEGKWETFKTCWFCAEVRTVFTCGGSWQYGSLWDDMNEFAFPALTTATECFRELTPAAKQRLLDRWQQWKGLIK